MIVRIDSATSAVGGVIGGKGLGLVRLLEAGLPVPDAWCIPADVSLDPAARAACLRAGLEEWWAAEAATRPGSLWAVRSSAVAEDLADASFAGVYETVLGVESLEGLRAAVTQCWSSLDQSRAETYRGAVGIDGDAGIALLLQRMIRADVAGVLLTANPLRPFEQEVVIDAAWGLGESVVSGRTEPDHFVLDRETGAVRAQRLGAKAVETVYEAGHGVTERAVDEARSAAYALTPDQLTELHGLARHVTDRIGARRDLEWAIEDGQLRVLQDRPITNLPSEKPDDIWSRVFGDEFLSECAPPLSAQLMLPWIVDQNFHEMSALQKRPDLVAMTPVRLHKGYAYISANYLLSALTAIPPKQREIDILAWFPPSFREQAMAMPFSRKQGLNMLTAASRDKEHSGIKGNLKALTRHTQNIERDVVPLLRTDLTGLTDAEWRSQLDLVDGLGREHFRVLRWGFTTYNALLHGALAKRLRLWSGDEDGALYQSVIGGLDDTYTAAINSQVRTLAGRAVEDPAIAGPLRAGTSYDDLRAATATSEFWDAYDEFVGQHGHRSDSRETSKPRWREEPHLLLEFVRAQLRAIDGGGESDHARLAVERRQEAEKVALSRAGVARRPILRRLIQIVQDYTRYRENQRYHLDYLITHMRALVMEQGRRLAERGVLASAHDVFHLPKEEFLALVGGEEPAADLRERVAASVAEHEQNSARRPLRYLYDDVETEGPEVEDDGSGADLPEGALRGAGVCRGVGKGAARVVASLSELGSVERGDVLVAPNIDPGWTSVFPLLSGLVIETGGTLSHGAILAREYGIPAVSGVTGACAAITDGAVITVDGGAGYVVAESADVSQVAHATPPGRERH